MITALLGGCVFAGCVVEPVPVAVRPRIVPVCRNPGATLLRLDNPGPAAAVVGRTLIRPGRALLCVPPGAPRLVAVQVWQPGPGQPPQPVRTPDGRALVGHPIAIFARGPGSASGAIDNRYVIPLPMTFANARPLPPPPPGSAPGAPPIANGPGQPATDSQDPGTSDSLYDAWSASEPPVEGDGRGDAALTR